MLYRGRNAIERIFGRLKDFRRIATRAAYDAAAKAQAAAAKVLATEYPKHARALVAVLRTVAEADALAEAANEALPEGCERLVSVEGRVRREPNVPARVTADEVVTAWCRAGGTRLHVDD